MTVTDEFVIFSMIFAGGIDQPSRIDLNQYSLVVTRGLVDGAGNDILGDGLNRVVDNISGFRRRRPNTKGDRSRDPRRIREIDSAFHSSPHTIQDYSYSYL